MILIKKPNLKLLILLPLLSLLLNGCFYFFDPLKIRIITSRARAQRQARILKASAQVQSITVKKGDTVYALSRQYNIPLRSLIEHNQLLPPYILKIGQKLNLPPAPFHIVQKGDTLYSISRAYSVEMASLARINSIKEPYIIVERQKLVLPGSVEQPGSVVLSSKTTNLSQKIKTKSSAQTPTINIPKPSARTSNKFAWPVKGKVLIEFGPLGKGRHNDGINIAAHQGSSVLAAENGVVAYSGHQLKSFGNLLLLKHDEGFMTAYAHNDTIMVKRGDKVKKGQLIATVGKTGSVTASQLHFEIRKGSKVLNPMMYLEP